MKISIITVSYNSASTIRKTLQSVAAQDYSNIEHIIVDGSSTDETLQIVREFPHVNKVISELDDGIYDAMNKGYSLASGDVVAFLNSDDCYSNATVLSEVALLFTSKGVDYVYGNLVFIDKEGNYGRYWDCSHKRYSMLDGVQMPHPSLFVRSDVLKRIDPVFDSSYRIAADFKQQLILVNVLNAKGCHIDQVLVNMALGGASTSGLFAYHRGWMESRRAYNDIFGRGGAIFTLRKVISKLKGGC